MYAILGWSGNGSVVKEDLELPVSVSCLYLPSAKITYMHHQAQFYAALGVKLRV